MSIHETPPPKVRKPHYMPIWRATAGTKIGMFMSNSYFPHSTHFYDDRTWVCQGDRMCLLCDKNVEKRWQGAAVIGTKEKKRPHLLLFTMSCVDEIERILEDKGMLAGTIVCVGRVGVDKRSQMFLRTVDWQPYKGFYFTKQDIAKYLEQVFAFPRNGRS